MKIYGLASGRGAETFGAELGVWDLYYNLYHQTDKKLFMEPCFVNNFASYKLNASNGLIDLFNRFQVAFLQQTKDEISNHKYLLLSGDHSNAIGIWSTLAISYVDTDIGLLWVDSHLDSHNFCTSPSKNLHGMSVATLMGYGDTIFDSIVSKKLKPENICFIGTNSYEEEELQLLNKLGVKIIMLSDITANNVDDKFQEAQNYLLSKVDKYGISFDVDVINNHQFPATGCYTQHGLDINDSFVNIKTLFQHPNCIALEITEYNPLKDQNRCSFNQLNKFIYSLLDNEQ